MKIVLVEETRSVEMSLYGVNVFRFRVPLEEGRVGVRARGS